MAHTPGTFCWTDLAAPDMDAAERFYGELLGWTSEPAGDAEQTGGYAFFTYDGQRAAGYGPPGPGEPPSWRAYVSVEDADETSRRAAAAGGQLLLEPMDVMDQGRMAVFSDPAGAVICIWQAKANDGAQLVAERGGLGWLEHATRDVDGAKRFYGAVFGWETEDLPGGYSIWKLGDAEVGGLTNMDDHPPEAAPHWLVNFVVETADGAAGRAGGLGGDVRVPPSTVEIPDRGELRFAVLADPSGAVFGVFEG